MLLFMEFLLEPGQHLEEIDVKVSGVSRHLVLQSPVFADIHDSPADHTNLQGRGVPWVIW